MSRNNKNCKESTIFSLVKESLSKNLENYFEQFLECALKIWDYRVNQGGSAYGLEYIFQTYFGYKLINHLSENWKVFISQSIKQILVNNKKYKEGVDVFISSNKRYIQPDFFICDDKGTIKEILEIKCIDKGDLSWVFSGDGKESNKWKGDICRLLKIKRKYPEICCFELIINRGEWNSNTWDNELFNKLNRKGLIEIRIKDKIFQDLNFKLVEILYCQKHEDDIIKMCYPE